MRDYEMIIINEFGGSYIVEKSTDENVQSCIDYIQKMLGFERIIVKNTQIRIDDSNEILFAMSCKMNDEDYKIVRLHKYKDYLGVGRSITNLEVIG